MLDNSSLSPDQASAARNKWLPCVSGPNDTILPTSLISNLSVFSSRPGHLSWVSPPCCLPPCRSWCGRWGRRARARTRFSWHYPGGTWTGSMAHPSSRTVISQLSYIIPWFIPQSPSAWKLAPAQVEPNFVTEYQARLLSWRGVRRTKVRIFQLKALKINHVSLQRIVLDTLPLWSPFFWYPNIISCPVQEPKC